ncbi:Sec-independent protein translocase protein TatB [uncultured Phenylobacterium sp.]|uniref:Sec-independent protein translocase protein TatB n=1 Tax=uncultured Phenylobacterium sp. TaxID=349273 RepID=UPI00345DA1E4
MLPEVGALEYLVIAAIALIVVGPKDLPMLLRRLGQFVAKLRGMASEFRASFDEMARQSELDDLRKEVEAMRKGQYLDMAEADQEMRSIVGDIEQNLTDVGVDLHGGVETFNYDEHIRNNPPLTISEDPTPKKPRAPRKSAAQPKSRTNGAKPTAAKPTTTTTRKTLAVAEAPKPRKARSAKTAEAGS